MIIRGITKRYFDERWGGNMKYKVIKNIYDGWEDSAFNGDILEVGMWHREETLIKNGKAICDLDSKYALENCIPLKDHEMAH